MKKSICFAILWIHTVCMGSVSEIINSALSGINPDLTFSGYTEGSYSHLARNNKFTSGFYNRVYDLNPSGFTLQQLSTTFTYLPLSGFGFVINPMIGRDTYAVAPYGWDADFGHQAFGLAIPQAYLQYNNNKLTIIAGEMYTLSGYEGVDPTKIQNFSRSILWGYATSTTALGIRGIYALNKLPSLLELMMVWIPYVILRDAKQ